MIVKKTFPQFSQDLIFPLLGQQPVLTEMPLDLESVEIYVHLFINKFHAFFPFNILAIWRPKTQYKNLYTKITDDVGL